MDRPADRACDPPYRDPPVRRTCPHRREETGQDPERRCPQKLGREARTGSVAERGLGYTHIHTAIDAYSRLAYSEFAGVENTINCVDFLDRAVVWFAEHGIEIERILTDNGNGHRSLLRRDRRAQLDIKHTRTKPHHPP